MLEPLSPGSKQTKRTPLLSKRLEVEWADKNKKHFQLKASQLGSNLGPDDLEALRRRWQKPRVPTTLFRVSHFSGFVIFGPVETGRDKVVNNSFTLDRIVFAMVKYFYHQSNGLDFYLDIGLAFCRILICYSFSWKCDCVNVSKIRQWHPLFFDIACGTVNYSKVQLPIDHFFKNLFNSCLKSVNFRKNICSNFCILLTSSAPRKTNLRNFKATKKET